MIKKSYLYCIVFFFLGGMVIENVFAQEVEKKVHLKVVKNGKTTIDTSFVTKSTDMDEIQGKISEMADVDVYLEGNIEPHEKHMKHHHGEHKGTKHKMVVVKSGDSEKDASEGSKKYVYTYAVDDDNDFTMKSDSMVIVDADTIILKKSGKVIVMSGDEDEDFEWIEKESDEKGEARKVMIMKDGEHAESGDGEVVVIVSDDDGSNRVKMVQIADGDTVGDNVFIKYISEDEDDVEVHDSKNVHVVVADDKSGTEFVSKEVKVVKSGDDDAGDVEITITIESGEKGKMEKATKKSSKKTKQKKEEKRKSK